MSAPRKIWTDHGSDEYTYGSANAYDSPYEASLHLYHHDDVVRELVDALTEAKKYHDADHGCNGFTCDYEVLRLQIDTALANISKEDQE